MRCSSRDTASAGSSSRCRSPSTNHSAIVSPGCWRAMIHTGCAPSPTTNRSRSRPCKLPPSRSRRPPPATQSASSARCRSHEYGSKYATYIVRNQRQVDRHRPAVVTRRHASPAAPVTAGHRAVVLPTLRVRGVAGVGEIHACTGGSDAVDAEVKPLHEFGASAVGLQIGPDTHLGRRAVGRDDFDRSAVEVAVDRECHSRKVYIVGAL